jgi:hypothetical protein
MSKGDFHTTEDDRMESAPPDFCAMGVHSFEIVVTDGAPLRICNDCELTEEVASDECIAGNEWFPEHDYHFGACRRCDAAADDDTEDEN